MNMGCHYDVIVKRAKLIPICLRNIDLGAPLALAGILFAYCVKFLCSDFKRDREVLEGFQKRASGKVCGMKNVSVLCLSRGRVGDNLVN